MNTATTQTSPKLRALDTAAASESELDRPDQGAAAQSTMNVVQKLQKKLRATRHNLEKMRVDPADESGPAQPHLLTETIANQLRLVNQERLDLMQQLGVDGGEKLHDVVEKMQREMARLKEQNAILKKQSPVEQSVGLASEKMNEKRAAAPKGTVMETALESLEPRPNAEMAPVPPQNTPSAMPHSAQAEPDQISSARTSGEGQSVPRPKTVLEQQLHQRRQASRMDSDVSGQEPEIREQSTGTQTSQSPEMLQGGEEPGTRKKMQEFREQIQQLTQQKEALILKNKELSAAVKRMHADQMALCKRFNVSSLSEMARLIMQTMNIQKAQAGKQKDTSDDLNSWKAVADLLQGWDNKINATDPNHSVKVERTGGSWALSANWMEDE